MNVEADLVMRALLSADESRRLYGAGHGAASSAMTRCVSSLNEAMGAEASLTVALTPRGVLVNDRVVADAGIAQGELFVRLSSSGIDVVKFTRGVSEADIEWLMLSAGPERPVSPTGSVLVSSLALGARGGSKAVTRRGASEGGKAGGEDKPLILPARLRGLWEHSITNQGGVNRETVAIATTITSAVMQNRSSLLPMVTLRGHDEYTFVHVINVAILASALGEALGLEVEIVRQLTEAALLHDVGKWLVPKRVLSKPGRLDASEREAIEQHPVTGAAILSASEGVSDLSIVVAYEHHRRIDGGGYPRRTASRPPSIFSQMVHVADFYDALRSDRPYRAGMEPAKCLEIMGEESGKAFEREIFEVFCSRVLTRVASAAREAA